MLLAAGATPPADLHEEPGVQVETNPRHLEVGYYPGRSNRGNFTVACERLKKAGVRKGRARRLGLALKGNLRLRRMGAVPATTHGTRVTGLTAGMIHQLDFLSFQMLGEQRSGRLMRGSPWPGSYRRVGMPLPRSSHGLPCTLR